MLKDRLKKYNGKLVVVQATVGNMQIQISGEVEVRDDDVVLVGHRSSQRSGPPIGQDASGQLVFLEEVVPASTIYFADLPDESLLVLKVIEETVQEAEAKLRHSGPMVLPAAPAPNLPPGMLGGIRRR